MINIFLILSFSQPYQLITRNINLCSPNIQSFIYCFFVCLTDEADDSLSQSRNIMVENKIQEC